MGSTPELCSGDHQKGSDLEGVEGATPPNIHSFKTMTTFNTDYSNTELLDQELSIHELQAAAGGKSGIDIVLTLPDELLTPKQRIQRDRIRAMREAGTV